MRKFAVYFKNFGLEVYNLKENNVRSLPIESSTLATSLQKTNTFESKEACCCDQRALSEKSIAALFVFWTRDYYKTFIQNLATLAALLNALRRKEARFEWTLACANAFGELKNELTSPRVLIYYDEHRELVLASDTWSNRVGAVISYRDDDATDRSIAFAL